MSGIIDYINWRGDLTFDTTPLNAVDNLIFSELSYMSFSNILQNKKEAPIYQIANEYLNSNCCLTYNLFYKK